MIGYKILVSDGEIGNVHDFFFNDEEWFVRYMVVNTGFWILGRKVLVSRHAFEQPVWSLKVFPVSLTKEKVKNSPDVDLDKPVSRQYEERLHEHYQWPVYWNMSAAMPGWPVFYIPPELFVKEKPPEGGKEEESHLRSTRELLGYRVSASDGEVGEVKDFMVEDDDWLLRYMLVKTGNWTDSNKEVLVALEWLEHINIVSRQVTISLDREAVRSSPAFDPTQPVNRQYEEVLYDYYGRPKYWQIIETPER